MDEKYTQEQLTHIINQGILYQCACPAQLSEAILDQRELFKYQQECLNQSETDKLVHQRIATSSEVCHKELEDCLQFVLKTEGWDPKTLDMPESFKLRIDKTE